jgi:ComF family protein
LNRLLTRILRAGLPDVCPVCVSRLRDPAADVCENCLDELHEFPAQRCQACGGAADSVLACCGECLRSGTRPWRYAVSVFPFARVPRELVHRFKYGGETFLAPFLARRLYQNWLRHGDCLPDLIVPVPLHWLKQLRRGFNQAELLAELLARHLAVPMVRCLVRRRSTAQQALLAVDERQRNMAGAFCLCRRANVDGLTILLVDDVLTTGATLGAAASALVRAGAACVNVITVARG